MPKVPNAGRTPSHHAGTGNGVHLPGMLRVRQRATGSDRYLGRVSDLSQDVHRPYPPPVGEPKADAPRPNRHPEDDVPFHKKHPFLGFLGAIAIVAGLVTPVIFFLAENSDAQIAESAKPLVNKILSDQLASQAKCERIVIIKRVSGNHYRAKAILDSGRVINISITRFADNILVELD